MSYPSDGSCVTCVTRNKKCDGTRGSKGCRRCFQAGIECGGFLSTSSRIPKPKHGIREKEAQASSEGYSIGDIVSSAMASSTNPMTQNTDIRLGGNTLTATHGFDDLDQPTSVPVPLQQTNPRSGSSDQQSIPWHTPAPSNNITTPVSQSPIPPIEDNTRASIFWHRANVSVILPSQANLPRGRFHIYQSQSIVPLAQQSPDLRLSTVCNPVTETEEGFSTGRTEDLMVESQSQQTIDSPASYLDNEPEPTDPENIEAQLRNELVLNRQVESNMISFLIHAYASWSTRFIFDPSLIVKIIANHFCSSLSYAHKTRMKMLLISSAAMAVSESTDYDLTDFMILHKQLVDRVAETQALGDAGMTREIALATMEHSHQFISTLFKVGSLASLLTVMDLYAPVFRRACPEPSKGLVNLPRCFTGMVVHLKYYAAMDVLQSFITQRPMFFRYDLDFLCSQDERMINAGGLVLSWLYGVPDWLIIVLARMNSLIEDFGNRVDLDTVEALEREIAACTPIVSVNPGTDPILNVGRITVQELWKMAAHVYLYMGLCGADSSDSRVVKIQNLFVRILQAIKPRRNPDSYLVLPMVILGVATTSPEDQSTLLTRLWGISECNRPETIGNDIVRMMKDIWARTTKRPAVWADLRAACRRITRM